MQLLQSDYGYLWEITSVFKASCQLSQLTVTFMFVMLTLLWVNYLINRVLVVQGPTEISATRTSKTVEKIIISTDQHLIKNCGIISRV